MLDGCAVLIGSLEGISPYMMWMSLDYCDLLLLHRLTMFKPEIKEKKISSSLLVLCVVENENKKQKPGFLGSQ